MRQPSCSTGNRDLYLMLIPGVALVFLFKYVPLYGVLIAFKEYNIFDGFGGSPWVGLTHFREVFGNPTFYVVLRNALLISALKIVCLFPLPIGLAVLLNEARVVAFRRSVQTAVYLPHFLSWSIVYGIFVALLSSDGPVNDLLAAMGLERTPFFVDARLFRGVLVLSEGWRDSGWGAIIYLAAITAIDPQLYEAAEIDGAGRVRRIWSITLPGILSTIMVLLILRLGQMLNAGFEQIIIMYNPTVYDVADVIETYVYRIGIGQQRFSYSTAVGLFNSLVGFVLIVAGNRAGRRWFGRSIW